MICTNHCTISGLSYKNSVTLYRLVSIVLKSANQTPDKAKVLFEFMKEQINDDSANEIERAVAFYVVNKCSFSGLTESSSFSAQASNNNFTMRGIEKLDRIW